MSDRQMYEEEYDRRKVEGDDILNASLCDEIADDCSSFVSSREAIYWRKKGIELAEKCYGKNDIRNTVYYDKIAEEYKGAGSYRQAEKWHQKSKKIKIKEKGKDSCEVLQNELEELRIYVELEEYEKFLSVLGHINNVLETEPDWEKATLYNAYYKRADAVWLYNIYNKESTLRTAVIEYWDDAIFLAQSFLGEDCIELAKAYRSKAFCFDNKEERLELFRKALQIAIPKEGAQGKTVIRIFCNVLNCWHREGLPPDEDGSFPKAIQWAYKNISREFVVNLIGFYSENYQQQGWEMIKALDTSSELPDAVWDRQRGAREDEECGNAAVSQEQEKAEGGLDVSSESLFSKMDFFKELENKAGNDCADELKDMIISHVLEDCLEDEEIREECKEYMEEECPDALEELKEDGLTKIVSAFRSVVKNIEKQESYLKLDAAFGSLKKKGIISLHRAGYTSEEGFEDCNEIAGERYEKGEEVLGCCFYTLQDLEHTLCEGRTLLYLSFGNYFENPSAEEVGEMIVGELEKEGLSVSWNHSAEEKIAVTDFVWQ